MSARGGRHAETSGDDGFETLPLRLCRHVFGEFFILFALERGRPRDVGAGVEKLGVDGVDVRLEDGERAFNLVYDLRRVGRLLLQRASSFASLLFGQSLGVFRRVRRVGRIVACRRVSSSFVARSPTRTCPPTRLVRQRPVLDLATAAGRSAAANAELCVTAHTAPSHSRKPSRQASTAAPSR